MSLGLFSKYATVPLNPQLPLVSPLGDLTSSQQNWLLAIILKNRGKISNQPSVCLSQIMFSDFLTFGWIQCSFRGNTCKKQDFLNITSKYCISPCDRIL